MVGVVVPWRTFESAERYGRILADVRARGPRRASVPRPSDRVWGASRIVELRRKRLPDAAARPARGRRSPARRSGS